MATISVSLPSDGTTADVADYNTPINTIVNEFNGNIDNNNIKNGAAIDGAKIAANSIDTPNVKDGAVTPEKVLAGTGTSWAWQSWTPTFTNLTVGSGTTVAKYVRVGKTVHFKLKVQLGAGLSVGSARFTLPVAFTSDTVDASTYAVGAPSGGAKDANGGEYPLLPSYYGTNEVLIRAIGAGSAFAAAVALSPTEPFTWAATDSIVVYGFYEVA